MKPKSVAIIKCTVLLKPGQIYLDYATGHIQGTEGHDR